MFVCVCGVRVCVCARACAYVCVCVVCVNRIYISLPPLQRILDKFNDHHNSQIHSCEEAIVDQRRLDANLEVRHNIFDILRVRAI